MSLQKLASKTGANSLPFFVLKHKIDEKNVFCFVHMVLKTINIYKATKKTHLLLHICINTLRVPLSPLLQALHKLASLMIEMTLP